MTVPGPIRAISEKSPINLGLVILGLGGIGSAGFVLAGAIWWASALQTKMDEVLRRMDTAAGLQVNTQKEISDLEKRVIVLEQKKAP